MDGENKKWYHSKTMWVNIIAGVSSVLVGLSSPEAGLSPKTVSIMGSIIAVANIVLRLITDKPIEK